MIDKNQRIIDSILEQLESRNHNATYEIDYDEDEELTTAVIESKSDNEFALFTLEFETGKLTYSIVNKDHKLTHGEIHNLENIEIINSLTD